MCLLLCAVRQHVGAVTPFVGFATGVTSGFCGVIQVAAMEAATIDLYGMVLFEPYKLNHNYRRCFPFFLFLRPFRLLPAAPGAASVSSSPGMVAYPASAVVTGRGAKLSLLAFAAAAARALHTFLWADQ